jgi:hypothetical protein
MKLTPLLVEEASKQGFTHRLDFSYKDIPAGIANNTAQVWTPAGLPAGTIVYATYLILVTPFQNTADTAFNSDTVSFGDTGSATRFISAVELNANGTFITDAYQTEKNQLYTTADSLKLTLNSMSGKSVSNLNRGQAFILLRVGNENRAAIIDTQGP